MGAQVPDKTGETGSGELDETGDLRADEPAREGPGGQPGGRSEMKRTTVEKRREDRQVAAAVATELAALASMATPALAAKWEGLTGEKARSHNATNLRKRLAWRIQELAFGGLSEAALSRIEELAPSIGKLQARPGGGGKGAGGAKPIVGRPKRDPRLPEAGTVVVRVYDGARHEVTVLEEGFEYRGERYRSLSKIARTITGTAWNGFTWMGLSDRKRSESNQEDAA